MGRRKEVERAARDADEGLMSLISSISNLKAAETAAQVQFAVAARALQTSRAQGQAMVALIQDAAESMNQAIEQMAGQIGSQLDVRA